MILGLPQRARQARASVALVVTRTLQLASAVSGRGLTFSAVAFDPAPEDQAEEQELRQRYRWYAGPANVPVRPPTPSSRLARRGRRTLVLVHRVPESGIRLRHAGHTRVIDESASGKTAIVTYARLAHADLLSHDIRDSLGRVAAERRRSLKRWLEGFDRSQIFATGPSISSVTPEDIDDRPGALRVACNSIVSSASLLSLLRPHVLTFGDPAFHFGDSEYAQTFRRDLKTLMLQDEELWAVVPEEFYPCLHEDFGEFERMVPCRVAPPRRFAPTRFADRTELLRTGNILTSAMLPIACAIGGSVEIFGCDGRSPEDAGFWRHSSKAQYDSLYDSVKSRHTSFFRDTDYEAYYRTHCERLSRMIAALESRQMTVRSKTPSYIPCLAERRV